MLIVTCHHCARTENGAWLPSRLHALFLTLAPRRTVYISGLQDGACGGLGTKGQYVGCLIHIGRSLDWEPGARELVCGLSVAA